MGDWQDLLKEKRVYILSAGVLVLVVFGFLFLRREPEAVEEELTMFTTSETQISSSEASPSMIYIDIKGAVRSPGMYQVEEGSRLIEAIDSAGGFTDEADQEQLNFALKLADQQVIYVPKIGEEIKAVGESIQGTTGNEEDDKVNINTADAQELQTLSGIGEKKAQDILAYREANGSFKEISELTNVSGIGEKTLEKIKDYITI